MSNHTATSDDIEDVEGFVYHVRDSRSQPDTETIYIHVDSTSGHDDRVFPYHVRPGTYKHGDSVKLKIIGDEAEIV